ncbi:SusC/RagA family TonB-linked outer membrane protein [Mucilaginibacter phyllosphaerae]|nr:SusC/RagA family TonB-linked outer membrane protein [Mucilaginibacter phyllosphaerae]
MNVMPSRAQLALAANTKKNNINYTTQSGQLDTEPRQTLKEVIEKLKLQYHIQVAFKEGLLNDKYVSAASLNENNGGQVELILTQLLHDFSLGLKKITANQYVIYQAAAPVVMINNNADIIKGKVLFAEDGTGVPGATITLKDDPKVGTTTDVNGNFNLSIPASYDNKPLTIIAAFIGYVKAELNITNRSAPVTIKLTQNSQALNEVVVTALGISKQKKALGYAITEVKGSELTQARENNVVNSLSGKVAGVNVAGMSTGPGGSSRVIIRGNGSLSRDNQPLYVVNGMPMNNSVPGNAPTTSGGGSNVDRGDGIAAINPDDIESVTVLKGGTAAALYGSLAANGAILITTKKGKAQKGIGVEFSSTATMETISVLPDFQYEYGQGDNGIKPTTLAAAQATGRRSWGAKIDGSTDYVGVDGLTHPYVAQKDNIKNYYQNGSTYTNTLALSGGSENLVYRFSVADLDSKGILPGTTYNRKTGNLSLNGKLSSKLSFEALAQYNLEVAHNRSSAGDATANPNWSPYMIANTADVRWLNPGYDAKGNETVWNDASVATNGYFVINKFKQNDRKNRFIGQGSISYEFVKDLVLKGTVSQDHYDYNYTNITPTGTLYALTGQYNGIKSDVTETNGLATLSYKKQIKDFGLSFLGGVNKRHFENNEFNQSGTGFVIPYFYSYNNLSAGVTQAVNQHFEVNSIFGSADFSYKTFLYLTATGRKDWFSTLSPQNNTIFYPSVNGSLILSEVLNLPKAINLLKLKGAYAQVGGGAPDPYTVRLSYSNVASSGQPLQNVSANTPGTGISGISNINLGPLKSTTSEGGIEAQLFNNRLSFDFTYYNRLTEDDIVNATISATSGYNNVILNSGRVRNRGIEALVSGTPIRSQNFTWTTSYNIAYNDNKVLSLTPGITSQNVASTVGNWGNLNNVVGMSSFEIYGTKILKDANGNTVFNATSGLPVATGQSPLGKSVAPLTMGYSNEFRYKRFNFSFLLDGKFGNKVFSIAEVYETRLGLLKTTLPGRENGLTLTGVDQTGAAYSRVVPVSGLSAYYNNYRNYSELFVHDGSFVKLRQAILSYSLPVTNIKGFKIQSANISLVGRNLLILYKKTDFDPEQSYSNNNFQGFESIGLPRTRSFGLNLSVKF